MLHDPSTSKLDWKMDLDTIRLDPGKMLKPFTMTCAISVQHLYDTHTRVLRGDGQARDYTGGFSGKMSLFEEDFFRGFLVMRISFCAIANLARECLGDISAMIDYEPTGRLVPSGGAPGQPLSQCRTLSCSCSTVSCGRTGR